MTPEMEIALSAAVTMLWVGPLFYLNWDDVVDEWRYIKRQRIGGKSK